MHFVIAASRKGYEAMVAHLSARYGYEFSFIGTKEELTLERLQDLKPSKVFFPHWSHIIPAPIYEAFECVIFHMTDVPFGRGGSPLQNLISRGIYDTQMTALQCVKELDAGPVYLKRPLALEGNAEEIYNRAAHLVEEMIGHMIEKQPIPQPQEGEAVTFTRRKPSESNIEKLDSLEQVFDYIRMLDAEGYPHAFIETEHLRFEFKAGTMHGEEVGAQVRIVEKKQ